MNQPWVYMCSPFCPSLPIPLLLNKSHQGLYALLRYILHYCNKYIVLMRNLCANIVLACYLLLPPNEWSRLAQWGHLKWGNGVMLLLLLSRFSRVRLCATPQTAAHQAPLSLGFSRQEHWSGLPFPSPMHESEKWKWSHSVVSETPWTAAYQAPPSMGFFRHEYWSGLPLPSPNSALN